MLVEEEALTGVVKDLALMVAVCLLGVPGIFALDCFI